MRKPIPILLLLLAFQPVSSMSAAGTLLPDDSFSIYLPVANYSLPPSHWRCYPLGEIVCPPSQNLLSVSMVSPDEGWAVGWYGNTSTKPGRLLKAQAAFGFGRYDDIAFRINSAPKLDFAGHCQPCVHFPELCLTARSGVQRVHQ